MAFFRGRTRVWLLYVVVLLNIIHHGRDHRPAIQGQLGEEEEQEEDDPAGEERSFFAALRGEVSLSVCLSASKCGRGQVRAPVHHAHRFIPEVHNKYLRCKEQQAARQREIKLKFVGDILESSKDNMLDDRVRLLTDKMEKNRRRQARGSKRPSTEFMKAAAGIVFLGIFAAALVFLFGSFYLL